MVWASSSAPWDVSHLVPQTCVSTCSVVLHCGQYFTSADSAARVRNREAQGQTLPERSERRCWVLQHFPHPWSLCPLLHSFPGLHFAVDALQRPSMLPYTAIIRSKSSWVLVFLTLSLHSQFNQPYSSHLIYPFSMFCWVSFLLSSSVMSSLSTPDSCLSHLLDFPCFGMSLAIKRGLLASFADHGSLPQDPARHISHKSSSVLLKPRPIILLFTSLLQERWTRHLTAATGHTTIRLHLSNNSSLFLNGPAEHLSQLALLTSAKTCVQHPSETSSMACTQPYCPSSRHWGDQRLPWELESVITRLPLVFYRQLYLLHLTNWVVCSRQGSRGSPSWSDSYLYWLLSQLFITHPKAKLQSFDLMIWTSPLQTVQPCCLTFSARLP